MNFGCLLSAFFKKSMRSKPKQPAVQLRGRALAGNKGEIPRLYRFQAASAHVLADCAGKRMLTRCLQRSCPFEQLLFRMSVQCDNFDDRRLSFRKSTGLIHGDRLQASRHLQSQPAFYENAVARGCRETGDNANWSGNHQCAGTADNQQDKRLVEPCSIRLMEDKRRDDCH